MKKPAKTVIPVTWATIRSSGAAQPGNRPGRGKSAHAKPAAKKPPPKGGPPKIVPGWFHPAVQAAAAKKKTAAKKAKKHPRRQLALGDGVACCSAEALAASLRLAGVPVSDDDVIALYGLTAADDDAGAPILATLEAAAEFGLAGVRLQCFAATSRSNTTPAAPVRMTATDQKMAVAFGLMPASVILGVDLPGPHAVLATADGWWSWGELYDPAVFPDAVIEEAWTIEWEA